MSESQSLFVCVVFPCVLLPGGSFRDEFSAALAIFFFSCYNLLLPRALNIKISSSARTEWELRQQFADGHGEGMVSVAQLVRALGCGPSGRGFESLHSPHAPVAQLDRASDFESAGRPFESDRARHFEHEEVGR